jgi:hypothetical protein
MARWSADIAALVKRATHKPTKKAKKRHAPKRKKAKKRHAPKRKPAHAKKRTRKLRVPSLPASHPFNRPRKKGHAKKRHPHRSQHMQGRKVYA